MKNPFNRLDELSRRQVMATAAKAAFGLSIVPVLGSGILSAATPKSEMTSAMRKKPATRCIYLYMAGGMTHIDTLDPKPGASTMGPSKAVSSKADGIQLGATFKQTAEHMKHGVVLRSMTSNQGAHEQAAYLMRTSYTPRNTVRHPSMAAWAQYFFAQRNETLPGGIMIGGGGDHPLSGYLEAKFAPLPVGDPAKGITNISPPPGVELPEMRNRLDVLGALNKGFYKKFDAIKEMRGHEDMYFDAVKLMASKDLEAFDIYKEPADVRARYGEDRFGKACLLSRRLVEKGVRFIDVSSGGWDMHDGLFNAIEGRTEPIDRGLSALIADLEKLGLLEDTLICLVTEFGRTPNINDTNGRDHYPKAFSSLLMGGGLKGGEVYGETDKEGREVIKDKMGWEDLNATIAYGMGMPLDKVITSPDGRPFTVAHKGKPLTQLFKA
jgi:hypothetical protein